MNIHITEEQRFQEWRQHINNARNDGCTCTPITYIVNNNTEYASLETVWTTDPKCLLHGDNP